MEKLLKIIRINQNDYEILKSQQGKTDSERFKSLLSVTSCNKSSDSVTNCNNDLIEWFKRIETVLKAQCYEIKEVKEIIAKCNN